MPSIPEPPEVATVPRLAVDQAQHQVTSFALTVIEGPEEGKQFSLAPAQPQRVLVGQSESCEVRLTDRQVSRRHIALELEPRRLRVTDLGSTNGTFVDGTAVLDAYLSGGEIVRIGATALRVEKTGVITAPLPTMQAFGRLLGASEVMRRLYPLCSALASSSVPVVIEGETGTGKEQLAEALHEMGPRAAGPFVVFDCTAVPSNLLESELFGHERGAFTGAAATRRGVFEEAHGGTLLIDEIGDLEPSLQPKLLRVVERSEVRRLGAQRATAVDVRVLAATRRNLDAEVQVGRFRDDLFHRLAVTRIDLPPLRQRTGDIALLVRHFWTQMGGDPRELTRDVLQHFEAHDWPGNVRELRNAVARRLTLGAIGELGAARSVSPQQQ